MSIYLAIAAGGALGAMSRYWVFNAIHRWLGQGFPYGVLTVNILGSLLMGFLSVLLVQRLQVGEELRAGLLLGFLGSFTTFSAFAMDTLSLLDQGSILKAMSYVLISVFFCVLGAWAGLLTAKQLI
ncbi:MAG: fluoride efflux transporter CrcB [Pseudomonadota bacterium]